MPPPQGTWNPIEGPGDYTMTKVVHSDTYPAIDPAKTADMSGKAVFISGGSRGIGRGIAISYAKAGASFIAIGARGDMSEAEAAVKAAAQEAGRPEPTVLRLKNDVTDAAAVEANVHTIEREFGRLDVVVNNAGVIGPGGLDAPRIAETDPLAWWGTMDVNFRGVYLVSRYTLPLLLKSPNGLKTIITVSSVGATLISPALSAYQTSKFAVLRLMEFIAKEYADQEVIAFSVHPGNVLTDIMQNGEGLTEEWLKIFSESKELCGDVLAFLSKQRRLWLAGRYVNVCWDMPEFVSEEKQREIVDGDKLKMKLVV